MFLVATDIEQRVAKVRRFHAEGESAIAVLLAAADCERTIRRAVLAMGTTPTKELAFRLGRRKPASDKSSKPRQPKYRSSIEGYNEAWAAEVTPRFGVRLAHELIRDWDGLHHAFQLRHELIHGDRGRPSADYAGKKIEVLLAATTAVHTFALGNGVNLTNPLPRRLRPADVPVGAKRR